MFGHSRGFDPVFFLHKSSSIMRIIYASCEIYAFLYMYTIIPWKFNSYLSAVHVWCILLPLINKNLKISCLIFWLSVPRMLGKQRFCWEWRMHWKPKRRKKMILLKQLFYISLCFRFVPLIAWWWAATISCTVWFYSLERQLVWDTRKDLNGFELCE